MNPILYDMWDAALRGAAIALVICIGGILIDRLRGGEK